MPRRVTVFGVASIALIGMSTVSVAAATHHPLNAVLHQGSTPEEQEKTAELNKQQLQPSGSRAGDIGGGNFGKSDAGGPAQDGLATEPTSYSKPQGDGMDSTGDMTPDSPSSSPGDQGVKEDKSIGSPKNETMGNPGGAATPPTSANP